jgi:hypothetical protein
MTDENTQTDTVIEDPQTIGEHPHAGVPQEGFASPTEDPQIAKGCVGQLVVKRHGAETDIVFPINPPAVIGRFDPAVGPIDVDLGSLDEGVYVSRKHAKIVCEDDVWKIVDMGSSNGTFLLGSDFERVEEGELADGTEIALGNARFVFHLVEC